MFLPSKVCPNKPCWTKNSNVVSLFFQKTAMIAVRVLGFFIPRIPQVEDELHRKAALLFGAHWSSHTMEFHENTWGFSMTFSWFKLSEVSRFWDWTMILLITVAYVSPWNIPTQWLAQYSIHLYQESAHRFGTMGWLSSCWLCSYSGYLQKKIPVK